jgi:hypothetical protein
VTSIVKISLRIGYWPAADYHELCCFLSRCDLSLLAVSDVTCELSHSEEATDISWTQLFNTLRTGLLNCLNARSRGLTFRHRASCI